MNDPHRVTFASLVLITAALSFARASRADEGRDVPTDRPSGFRVDASRDRASPEDADNQHPRKPEHFRIGVLGGVGFPRPLAIEGLVKVERTLALGAEYSVLPTVSISGVETRLWALSADARFFPLQNGFFLGVRAGHQHLDASGSLTVSSYGTFPESLTVDTTFVNPRLGFLWTFEPGITIGIDAGVQIPLSTASSNTLPAGTLANSEVNRVANSYGNKILPTLDLLRLGFLL